MPYQRPVDWQHICLVCQSFGCVCPDTKTCARTPEEFDAVFAPPICTRCQSNPAMEFDTICDPCFRAEYAMTPLTYEELGMVKRPVRHAKVYCTCSVCGQPVEYPRYETECNKHVEDLPF